ncbi:MAG: hypothetical protein NUV53_00855 [Patescibacteria group bacterium]|nr:hypothetical protein [Patescibacteria group bacterium]
MATVTIPKQITKGEELVVLTRKEYEKFLDATVREKEVSAADMLRWSREAKQLKKQGKLPVLRSLKDLR